MAIMPRKPRKKLPTVIEMVMELVEAKAEAERLACHGADLLSMLDKAKKAQAAQDKMIHDQCQTIDAIAKHRDDLTAQIKRWEDKEVRRACDCEAKDLEIARLTTQRDGAGDIVDEIKAELRDTYFKWAHDAVRLQEAEGLLAKAMPTIRGEDSYDGGHDGLEKEFLAFLTPPPIKNGLAGTPESDASENGEVVASSSQPANPAPTSESVAPSGVGAPSEPRAGEVKMCACGWPVSSHEGRPCTVAVGEICALRGVCATKDCSYCTPSPDDAGEIDTAAVRAWMESPAESGSDDENHSQLGAYARQLCNALDARRKKCVELGVALQKTDILRVSEENASDNLREQLDAARKENKKLRAQRDHADILARDVMRERDKLNSSLIEIRSELAWSPERTPYAAIRNADEIARAALDPPPIKNGSAGTPESDASENDDAWRHYDKQSALLESPGMDVIDDLPDAFKVTLKDYNECFDALDASRKKNEGLRAKLLETDKVRLANWQDAEDKETELIAARKENTRLQKELDLMRLFNNPLQTCCWDKCDRVADTCSVCVRKEIADLRSKVAELEGELRESEAQIAHVQNDLSLLNSCLEAERKAEHARAETAEAKATEVRKIDPNDSLATSEPQAGEVEDKLMQQYRDILDGTQETGSSTKKKFVLLWLGDLVSRLDASRKKCVELEKLNDNQTLIIVTTRHHRDELKAKVEKQKRFVCPDCWDSGFIAGYRDAGGKPNAKTYHVNAREALTKHINNKQKSQWVQVNEENANLRSKVAELEEENQTAWNTTALAEENTIAARKENDELKRELVRASDFSLLSGLGAVNSKHAVTELQTKLEREKRTTDQEQEKLVRDKETAESEADRLREALKRIAGKAYRGNVAPEHVVIAYTALNQPKEGEGE